MKKKIRWLGVINCIINVILAASCSILSFHQILIGYYNIQNILLTAVVAFTCAFWFAVKTGKTNFEYIKNHIGIAITMFILAVCILWKEYECKCEVSQNSLEIQLPVNFFRIRWYFFSAIFFWYFSIWLLRKMIDLLQNIWNELDLLDKRIYIVLSIVFSIGILIAYVWNPLWYLQYDQVYSIDSGWCCNCIFPQFTYYDIRHPILNQLTFPIWALIDIFLSLCAPLNMQKVLCAVCIQFINVQFLLFIGLILRILLRSRFAFLLYTVSFPTLLFSLSLEKYQMCVCLVVLYVYKICVDADSSQGVLILTAGIMPTNGFIGICELFTDRPLISKLKKIAGIFLYGIAVMICTGRGHFLNLSMLYREIMAMKMACGSALTIKERLIAVTKMIHSSFVGLSSYASEVYMWSDMTAGVSVLCVMIIMLMITGAICNWNMKCARIAFLWTVFSIVLLVILNWSPQAGPLFAVLFSWAFFTLFILGMDWVIKKCGMNRKIVYIGIIAVMAVINLAVILDIHKFLLTCTEVVTY